MALYRVLFSGVAGSFVAYAAIATVAAAASLLVPDDNLPEPYQIVDSQPANPDSHPSYRLERLLSYERQVATLADGDDRHEMGEFVIRVLA